MMSNSTQTPISMQPVNSVTLIPVGLKEAALDSPTFRSSFTHFSEQIDHVEKWLDTLARSIDKASHEIGALESLSNALLMQTMPPSHLSPAVIDHDSTLLVTRRYGECVYEFWNKTISYLRKMEFKMVEPIRLFLQNELQSFKEIRRNFEHSQKQLDNLQARYSAQTRTKESFSLREDAFQLHEARKVYLKASMDFGVTMPHIRFTLDKLLIKIFSEQWRDMHNSEGPLNNTLSKWGAEIDRVQGWNLDLQKSERRLGQELQNARRQIEERAELAARPSREIEDYAFAGKKGLSTANLPASNRAGLVKPDKQSWLNLRTTTGKPPRTVWLRRWFFVNNGIFGWLVQSSRSGGVEECARIGVLLCNVRSAVAEERRYCFEVKTNHTAIIVQAETQHELTDWIGALEAAKQKALEDPASIGSLDRTALRTRDATFAVLPPSAPEFAASATDAGIQQLSEDNQGIAFERSGTLSMSGLDIGLGMANRSNFDVNSHWRSIVGERESESGRDHTSRIIHKLDLHKKSTSGPPMAGNFNTSQAANANTRGGGVASLIAASHNVVPLGPANTLSAPLLPETSTLGVPSSITARGLRANVSAPVALAAPPAPTNLSLTAVMVTSERGITRGYIGESGGMPSGILANIWGTSNWGYLNSVERRLLNFPMENAFTSSDPVSPKLLGTTMADKKISSSGEGDKPLTTTVLQPRVQASSFDDDEGANEREANFVPEVYPESYPLQLRLHDAQFRLFFPKIGPKERLIFVFRAIWNHNNQQDLPGRVYVTATKIYFYSTHLGFVLIFGVSLESISEVTTTLGRDCDFLFIHLKDGDEKSGCTRITIKTFVEPLKLLQNRLNFMIQNYKSHQVPDYEHIMKGLMRLEQDDPVSSCSLESWKDVPENTPIDDDLSSRQVLSQKGHQDLKATVLIDRGLLTEANKFDEVKDANKFKLPRQPVEYVPSGMDRLAVKKIFDISPKALFHVICGDRSAVWQLLYHERDAQCIKQSSWRHLKDNHLWRNFEYRVETHGIFQKSHQVTVVDHQMIDVINDHLCYVISDRKSPWNFPYHEEFVLLSKIVITHVAKSRCKLAIYTKVDWIKPVGTARSIVTNQALLDLEQDALDFVDVIADQVRKLGASSPTKKAMQIFGLVGQQTQISQFSGSDMPLIPRNRRRLERRTLMSLILMTCVSWINRFLNTLKHWVSASYQGVWKTVDAHVVLVGFLACSIIANIILSSSITSEWRRERDAGKFMVRMGIGSNSRIAKAIYLHDLEDAVARETQRPKNTCHETFRALTSLHDLDGKQAIQPLGFSPSSQVTAWRIRSSRQRMGVHRHNLLVAMRVVNSVEREMIQAEWDHWLMNEMVNCQQLDSMIRGNYSSRSFTNRKPLSDHRDSPPDHDEELRGWYESYCESCSIERNRQLSDGAGSDGLW